MKIIGHFNIAVADLYVCKLQLSLSTPFTQQLAALEKRILAVCKPWHPFFNFQTFNTNTRCHIDPAYFSVTIQWISTA
ncbi:MAG: hypothetical protein IPP72_15190 [Chitinophagaceae bacterium]|nr:hypothetical protein [Chitinophagaceae bacterium]